MKDRRGEHGVKPMCCILQITQFTFYEHQASRVIQIARRKRPNLTMDCALNSYLFGRRTCSVYGALNLWHATKRDKIDIARCTIE